MSENVLQFAREEILRTILKHYSDITLDEAEKIADELIEAIDWDNPALMHKSIAWITMCYLRNRINV